MDLLARETRRNGGGVGQIQRGPIPSDAQPAGFGNCNQETGLHSPAASERRPTKAAASRPTWPDETLLQNAAQLMQNRAWGFPADAKEGGRATRRRRRKFWQWRAPFSGSRIVERRGVLLLYGFALQDGAKWVEKTTPRILTAFRRGASNSASRRAAGLPAASAGQGALGGARSATRG